MNQLRLVKVNNFYYFCIRRYPRYNMQPTDSELLQRMRNGDTGALGILYIRYSASVNEFALRFIGEKTEAEDITHNVFVQLWDHRSAMNDVESFKAYLFRMTKNRIFKFFRHKSIVKEWESNVLATGKESFTDTETQIETSEIIELIDLKISQMPEKQRQIFCMSRYENLTYAEIAEKLDISPKSVQRYISLALADLRNLLNILILFTSIESVKSTFDIL